MHKHSWEIHSLHWNMWRWEKKGKLESRKWGSAEIEAAGHYMELAHVTGEGGVKNVVNEQPGAPWVQWKEGGTEKEGAGHTLKLILVLGERKSEKAVDTASLTMRILTWRITYNEAEPSTQGREIRGKVKHRKA